MDEWPCRVSTGSPPPAGTAAWYVRQRSLPQKRWAVRCVVDDRHPDGQVIDDPGPLEGMFVLWCADLDDEGRTSISVSPGVMPGAPECWFVILPEPDASPPAVTLVAFATDHVPAGRVIGDPEFFHLPVRSDEQIGAIRWWPDEAVVDQVFVAEHWRRLHVATVLIYTASAYHQHHGWPGRLHSDGRRTTMGELLVTGLRHPDRIARLERLMESMDTPPDGA